MPNLLGDDYFLQKSWSYKTEDHPRHCDVIFSTKENVGGCQARIVYRNVVSILDFFRCFPRPVSRIRLGHLMMVHVIRRGFSLAVSGMSENITLPPMHTISSQSAFSHLNSQSYLCVNIRCAKQTQFWHEIHSLDHYSWSCGFLKLYPDSLWLRKWEAGSLYCIKT